MQLTYNKVNTAGPQYQSFLPGGYILFFGIQLFTNPTTTETITLVPLTSSIVVAIAYGNNTSSGAFRAVTTNITSANTFDIITPSYSSPTLNFTWMAIARQ